MTVETQEQLQHLQTIGRIVAETVQVMGQALRPGITTRELDDIGRAYLASHGARSAPEAVYQFPGATCISVNHEVAHGIPGDRKLQAGDTVNIDVSAELNGFFGDTGYTFVVGPASPEQQRITQVCQEALRRAIAVVRTGVPLNKIGQTIEATAREFGCSIITNLGSHGVGKALHEEPFFIAPYYDADDKRILTEGMVITIEPFISNGAWQVQQANDGWTLYTEPAFITAQYEHSMVVTANGATLLTDLTAA